MVRLLESVEVPEFLAEPSIVGDAFGASEPPTKPSMGLAFERAVGADRAQTALVG